VERKARDGASRDRVVEIQRARLLAAALGAIDEMGYPQATVARVASRARVSRRTFYDLFENREDCLLAALEDALEMVRGELADADLDELSWRERVRRGLWTILEFFDREPVLARVCVVQALRGGPRVLERREQVLAELASIVDEGRYESSRSIECPSVTAEGLVGAGFTIVYGRLLRGEPEPLTSLLGELMGMIVLPYQGPAAARREQAQSSVPRGEQVRSSAARPDPSRTVFSPYAGENEHAAAGKDKLGSGGSDPLAGVPMRMTYRTALVLDTIAQQPGVSNRVVADLAEISDQGQVSKLLSRLERLGLIENTGEGHAKGEPNAWILTGTGRRIAQGIRTHTSQTTSEKQYEEAGK
jgi:AcrR family transcriptional regulator